MTLRRNACNAIRSTLEIVFRDSQLLVRCAIASLLVALDLRPVRARCCRRRAFIDNHSVLHANDALGMAGHIVVVSNDDEW